MNVDKDKKIFVVVPAFNEERVILNVIKDIEEYGYENIIVVDDGSSDDTFQKAKLSPRAVVLRHSVNRGKGAATKTGIEAAKLLGADIVVTMDGDGQHDPGDIEKLITPIIKQDYEVALGTRLKNTQGMPFYKIILNHFGNIITWYLFGLYVTDSQSGFRAYSKRAMEIINTRGDRYEYDSDIIREIYLSKLKYKEVPINVIYTDYSMQKVNKQGFVNGLKTLYKMVLKLIN